MNRAVPEDTIEEIRSRCDIVDVIRGYIPVKKAGSGRWKALCPFHQEKTPSFVINEQRQHYHCFGCGRGGDAFKFVMEWEKVDFPNAIHLLAAKCGVVIPEKTYSNPAEKQQAKVRADRRERLYQLNDEFAKWYMKQLRQNADSPVARYLASRGTPDDIAEKFQLGAAPDSWDASLNYGKQLGFSQDELLESGIVLVNEESKRIYDRFRNRLIFPIWNEQSRVVGFSARTIEADAQGAKYVNSPETPVFRKSGILYALPLARRQMQEDNMAILCEGQLDVIAMHRAGFGCAVAPQGTAFTEEQARILKRYSERVFIAFDSDLAGRKAALRTIEILLPLDFEIMVVNMPEGEDPDGIFNQSGAEGLARIINAADDLLDALCKAIFPNHDAKSPHGKSRITAEILQYLRKISRPVVREQYVQRLSSRLGIRPETIFAELNRIKKAERNRFHYTALTGSAPTAEAEPVLMEPELPPELAHAEETLLELALSYEDIAVRLANELPETLVSNTPPGRALNELMSLTLNGEWSAVPARLADIEREQTSPRLSRILATETSYSKNKSARAAEECLAVIMRQHSDRSKAEIMRKLKQAATPEEKQSLMRQLLELT